MNLRWNPRHHRHMRRQRARDRCRPSPHRKTPRPHKRSDLRRIRAGEQIRTQPIDADHQYAVNLRHWARRGLKDGAGGCWSGRGGLRANVRGRAGVRGTPGPPRNHASRQNAGKFSSHPRTLKTRRAVNVMMALRLCDEPAGNLPRPSASNPASESLHL